MNYLTPTKKPIGWVTDAAGKPRRVFDTPRTPLDRLLASNTLTSSQRDTLLATRDQLGPNHLAREIDGIQQKPTAGAKTATLDPQAAHTKTLPDTRQGVKLAKASEPHNAGFFI
jgi:hypothetical protein